MSFWLIFTIAIVIIALSILGFLNSLKKLLALFAKTSLNIKAVLISLLLASILAYLKFPLGFTYDNTLKNSLRALVDILFWFSISFFSIKLYARTKKWHIGPNSK